MKKGVVRLPVKIGAFFVAVISFAVTLASAIGIAVLVGRDAYQTSKEKLSKNYTERYLYTQVNQVMSDYLNGISAREQPEMNYYYRITDPKTGEELASDYAGEDFSYHILTTRSYNVRYLTTGESGNLIVKEADGEFHLFEIPENELSEEEYVVDTRECRVELWAKKDPQVQDRLYLYNRLLDFGYAMRYPVFPVLFFFGLLTLGSLIYLYWAAGKTPDRDEAACNFFDRVPLEIYTLFFAALVFAEILLMKELRVYEWFLLYKVGFVFAVLLADFMAFCVYTLSFATRVKTKTLWKNTLLFRLLSFLRRAARAFLTYLPLIWKTILVLIVFNAVFLLTGVFSDNEFVFLSLLLASLVLDLIALFGAVQFQKLLGAGERIAKGKNDPDLDPGRMIGDFKKHGEDLLAIGDGINAAVEEKLKSERFKTELITNVSHDIKTPLTSIINYADLLSKLDLENENARSYAEVISRQSNRLKKLAVDLVEASKASSGAIRVEFAPCELNILLQQALGECEEKWKEAGVTPVITLPEKEIVVSADPRLLGRVIDNLFSNVAKYAQSGTRAYLSLEETEEGASVILRNISRAELNISGEELMERFVRGDSSRNTEGSGLGLSIARTLTELQKGTMTLAVDGDLFKVTLTFPKIAPASRTDF